MKNAQCKGEGFNCNEQMMVHYDGEDFMSRTVRRLRRSQLSPA
jgi:hypothetical protein